MSEAIQNADLIMGGSDPSVDDLGNLIQSYDDKFSEYALDLTGKNKPLVVLKSLVNQPQTKEIAEKLFFWFLSASRLKLAEQSAQMVEEKLLKQAVKQPQVEVEKTWLISVDLTTDISPNINYKQLAFRLREKLKETQRTFQTEWTVKNMKTFVKKFANIEEGGDYQAQLRTYLSKMFFDSMEDSIELWMRSGQMLDKLSNDDLREHMERIGNRKLTTRKEQILHTLENVAAQFPSFSSHLFYPITEVEVNLELEQIKAQVQVPEYFKQHVGDLVRNYLQNQILKAEGSNFKLNLIPVAKIKQNRNKNKIFKNQSQNKNQQYQSRHSSQNQQPGFKYRKASQNPKIRQNLSQANVYDQNQMGNQARGGVGFVIARTGQNSGWRGSNKGKGRGTWRSQQQLNLTQ